MGIFIPFINGQSQVRGQRVGLKETGFKEKNKERAWGEDVGGRCVWRQRAVNRQAGLGGERPSTVEMCRVGGNRKTPWMVG